MKVKYIENMLLWLARLIDVTSDYTPNKQYTNTIAYNLLISVYDELEGL